jgi:hypothetical protein
VPREGVVEGVVVDGAAEAGATGEEVSEEEVPEEEVPEEEVPEDEVSGGEPVEVPVDVPREEVAEPPPAAPWAPPAAAWAPPPAAGGVPGIVDASGSAPAAGGVAGGTGVVGAAGVVLRGSSGAEGMRESSTTLAWEDEVPTWRVVIRAPVVPRTARLVAETVMRVRARPAIRGHPPSGRRDGARTRGSTWRTGRRSAARSAHRRWGRSRGVQMNGVRGGTASCNSATTVTHALRIGKVTVRIFSLPESHPSQ